MPAGHGHGPARMRSPHTRGFRADWGSARSARRAAPGLGWVARRPAAAVEATQASFAAEGVSWCLSARRYRYAQRLRRRVLGALGKQTRWAPAAIESPWTCAYGQAGGLHSHTLPTTGRRIAHDLPLLDVCSGAGLRLPSGGECCQRAKGPSAGAYARADPRHVVRRHVVPRRWIESAEYRAPMQQIEDEIALRAARSSELEMQLETLRENGASRGRWSRCLHSCLQPLSPKSRALSPMRPRWVGQALPPMDPAGETPP